MKKYLAVYSTDKLLWRDIQLADTYWLRLRGLLHRQQLGEQEGLLIRPCNQIHSIGMRIAIDTIYLDHDHTILKIETLQPGRIRPSLPRTDMILEVPADSTQLHQLQVGQRIRFESKIN
ncbi:MAG: DUF192 domain-containing protein [Eubacteriales bacterium]|nr:DUF192 domain-containing protein [Eubacteriales bacterium]